MFRLLRTASRRRRPAPRLIAILCTLCLPPGACTTWQAHSGSPADLRASEAPGVVRASIGQDSVLVIGRPEVRGDSLVGINSRSGSSAHPALGTTTEVTEQPIAIPLTDITQIASRRVSVGKSVGLRWAVWVNGGDIC